MKYEAYHTDVQRVIDSLQKMNDVLDSRHIEDAMRTLEILSWRLHYYEKSEKEKTDEV